MTSIEECSLVLSMEDVGSKVDLTALVEAHSTLLFRVAHSVLRSRPEAEDVVQDAFVRVVERRSSLPAVRDMRVWLIRITWNLAIDRRRRIRPEQMDENFAESLVASSMPADQVLDEAQRMGAVLRELERLPRAERHVLLLSSLEELGTAEMAKVLGRSEMRRAKVIRSSDSEALREMQTASYPAPPMPLTEQEKLLLRIAHKKRSGGVRDVE